ncbi:NADH-ubiquinone oxidoreductase B12 subunit family-domain-containing protein, partial [Lasiosphaeris hirsuta]
TRILRADKPNVTGFDIRKFAKAAAEPKYDPWGRSEAWRYEGQFSRFNRFKKGFPGLGIASVAFAAYCTYEHFFLKDEHHGHAAAHGEEHH